MINNADHSGHTPASRIMTVMAVTAEQKQASFLLRQRVQEQQGLRCRRISTNAEFEQQLLVLNRIKGMSVATVGLRSSRTGGQVEGEFDLRGLLSSDMDYLELDGPVMLPGYNPDKVLTQCLELIGENYAACMPKALVSRISLPLAGGDKYIQSLMFYLRNSNMCTTLARPRVPLRRGDVAYADDLILPGMLRAFIRRGACIASEPYWDAEQGRAKILVWIESERLFAQPYQHQLGTRHGSELSLSA